MASKREILRTNDPDVLLTAELGHGVPKPDGQRPCCDAGFRVVVVVVVVEDGSQFRGMACFDDFIVALGRGEFEAASPVILRHLEFFHESFRGALEGNSDTSCHIGCCF